MFLGDVLGAPVLAEGERVGFVNDVRLYVPDRTGGQQVGTPEVFGIVVCPRRTGSFDGFERSGMRAPWLLARWFHWRTRGSFLVLWDDLATWGEAAVDLRPGAARWSAALSPR